MISQEDFDRVVRERDEARTQVALFASVRERLVAELQASTEALARRPTEHERDVLLEDNDRLLSDLNDALDRVVSLEEAQEKLAQRGDVVEAASKFCREARAVRDSERRRARMSDLDAIGNLGFLAEYYRSLAALAEAEETLLIAVAGLERGATP